MAIQNAAALYTPCHETGASFMTLRAEIAEKCLRCGACQRGCAFLQKYGTPGEIAASYNPAYKSREAMPYECSLCQLCASVCREKLNPGDLFIGMRREMMRLDHEDYREHAGYLAYEKRGVSRRFTYYALPAGCDAIFFPGCSLPGTRPDLTFAIYEHLKDTLPTLGIVLDCCLKISHDLGRDAYFQAMFQEMLDFLIKSGVKKVIVACPNCHRIFSAYGKGMEVRTIYEIMDGLPLPLDGKIQGAVTIHDPCPLRFAPAVHQAVRSLIIKSGLTIEEMPHHGANTLCCGEGGFVAALAPELAGKWRELRRNEAAGRRMITYCAGCTNHFEGITPASHIVELLWQPQATMAGTFRFAKSPMTYWNRLKLKKKLQKEVDAPITRERTFTGMDREKKGLPGKRLLLLGAIVVVILALRLTGAARYLEEGTLHQWIEGYGSLAPLVYMLIYALAPSLLLPGLPLTIAGGILFGPLWGVVYTITGATVGACIAFLVARYVARDWVERKLRSPKWRRLDEGVEKQGWKVVAVTRLIPLFPFNLLNYAFGLTGIRFLPYAVASFFFMLPACIAYIVFSSSLLDLLKGKISPTFVAGLALVILVTLIPLLYGHYNKRRKIK